jgi:hypothetical protein
LLTCLLLPPPSPGFYNCPVVRDGFEAEARGWAVADRHRRARPRLASALPLPRHPSRATRPWTEPVPPLLTLTEPQDGPVSARRPKVAPGPRRRFHARASVLCRWHERQVWTTGVSTSSGTPGNLDSSDSLPASYPAGRKLGGVRIGKCGAPALPLTPEGEWERLSRRREKSTHFDT